MLIRPASSEEIEALAALHVRTWQEAYAGLMPDEYLRTLKPSDRLPVWKRLFADDRVTVFVVESDGELIGFSCGGPSDNEDADATTGELWSIYLLKQYWGKGIGKQLHDTLIDHLRDCGFQKLTLWVLEANKRTRRWYERQGWELEGSRKTDERFGPRGAPLSLSEVRYAKELV